jgi:dolichol kinase
MCTAFIPFLLSHFYYPVIALLILVTAVYTAAEIVRLNGRSVPIISAVTQAAARKRDEHTFVLGPVTLTAGIIITALVFDPVPASVGIYALAFGDGLASLSGKLLGRVSIPFTNGKTVIGSLTCFCAIFVSSYLVLHNACFALLLAVTGMFIELIPLKDFDNLLIPILIAGAASYLLF